MGINGTSLIPLNQIAWQYTVTFANRTPDTMRSVVVTYAVRGEMTPRQLQIDNWGPGRIDVFALCPCPNLVDYAIAIFTDDGQVISIPPENDPLGPMTPRRASQFNPTDQFLCEDSWSINPGP